MILLIAAYSFNWPESLQSFFDFSRPITQPYSEMLTLDCIIGHITFDSAPIASRLFFQKILWLGVVPFLFGVLVWLYW